MNILSQLEKLITSILDTLNKTNNLREIKQILNIMATKQEEFNAQLEIVNAKLGEQKELFKDLSDQITSETGEVTTAIDELKKMIEEGNVDFTRISGVIQTLDSHKESLESMVKSVDGIYEKEVTPVLVEENQF